MNLRYAIEFTAVQQRHEVIDEFVENQHRIGKEEDVDFFYRFGRLRSTGFPKGHAMDASQKTRQILGKANVS